MAATERSRRLAGTGIGVTRYVTEHAAGRTGRTAGAVCHAVSEQVGLVASVALPRVVTTWRLPVIPGDATLRFGQIFTVVAGELSDAGDRKGTRLNSRHQINPITTFFFKKKHHVARAH